MCASHFAIVVVRFALYALYSLLSAQAQKKCFIYWAHCLVVVKRSGTTIHLTELCAHHAYLHFFRHLYSVFECIFYLCLIFSSLSLSLSSFESQWSLRYDLDHNTISTNNCFDFELFFFLILSLWPILLLLKVTIQFFSHSVSHVSFEFHTQSHRVNSKVNEEL